MERVNRTLQQSVRCQTLIVHYGRNILDVIIKKVKVKCSRYRPGVAQRVGRFIALLFHDRGTRRE